MCYSVKVVSISEILRCRKDLIFPLPLRSKLLEATVAADSAMLRMVSRLTRRGEVGPAHWREAQLPVSRRSTRNPAILRWLGSRQCLVTQQAMVELRKMGGVSKQVLLKVLSGTADANIRFDDLRSS